MNIREELDTLMSGHGVTFDNPGGEVTIYTKAMMATAGVQDYVRCNAMVEAPRPGDTLKAVPGDNLHWQDAVFTYYILEELEED